jgi:hypothetical protein
MAQMNLEANGYYEDDEGEARVQVIRVEAN